MGEGPFRSRDRHVVVTGRRLGTGGDGQGASGSSSEARRVERRRNAAARGGDRCTEGDDPCCIELCRVDRCVGARPGSQAHRGRGRGDGEVGSSGGPRRRGESGRVDHHVAFAVREAFDVVSGGVRGIEDPAELHDLAWRSVAGKPDSVHAAVILSAPNVKIADRLASDRDCQLADPVMGRDPQRQILRAGIGRDGQREAVARRACGSRRRRVVLEAADDRTAARRRAPAGP